MKPSWRFCVDDAVGQFQPATVIENATTIGVAAIITAEVAVGQCQIALIKDAPTTVFGSVIADGAVS